MKMRFETGRGSIWVYDTSCYINYHVCIDDSLSIIGPLTTQELLGKECFTNESLAGSRSDECDCGCEGEEDKDEDGD